MMYVARCKYGKIVAACLANTPWEQAEAARDVKRWSKKYTVNLEDKSTIDEWCLKSQCRKCTGLEVKE